MCRPLLRYGQHSRAHGNRRTVAAFCGSISQGARASLAEGCGVCFWLAICCRMRQSQCSVCLRRVPNGPPSRRGGGNSIVSSKPPTVIAGNIGICRSRCCERHGHLCLTIEVPVVARLTALYSQCASAHILVYLYKGVGPGV